MKNKLLTMAALATGGVMAARRIAAKNRAFAPGGKVVFITGGSRGLGLELARQLSDEGARLAICARDEDELEAAREELETQGAEVFAATCDITNQNQLDDWIQNALNHYATVDVLINNAGVIQVAPVEVMTSEYEEAMNTHFWASLHAIEAVLPEMKRNNAGRIVNIASIGGKVAAPHMTPYCASKFALVGLSHGLRAELAQSGIVVTTVCPPLVRTGGFYHAVFKGQHKKEFAIGNIADSNPVLSISTEQAARRIIISLKRGDAETMLSKRAQATVLLTSLFPGVTADVLALSSKMLPKADGESSIGTSRASGFESTSVVSESPLTILNQQAARDNNERSGTHETPATA